LVNAASIRTSTVADVPLIARLRAAWTEEYAGQSIDDDDFLSRFEDWFARESDQRVTWLAEVDREAVGMLNMLAFTRMPRPRRPDETRPSHQWGYIANVFVAEAARNSGIGRQLLDAATAYAVEHGFARIVLSPSERSVPFYAHAGFVPATSLLIKTL
jgi:GNAT superfamily N-acetyltransferase